MADTRYVRFRYGPTVHTVAMYPGLPAEEFSMILKALLPVHVRGNIIGLQGEQGEVVPITLSCRSPEVLSDSTYVLLVSGESSTSTPHLQQETQVLPSAPPLSSAQQEEAFTTNIAPPAPPLKPSTNPEYDDELSAEDAQDVDNTMDELLRFIAGLRVKRIINKDETESLEELLFSNSSLVLAAYSVAKSAGDSQYLANICKDIAQSMMTTAGRSACAAQDEVLQCCDHLYLARKITDNQLLFLRHLVLIREEEVAEVYDNYQVHRDLDRLLQDLHRIAYSQPSSSEDDEIADRSEDEDDDVDDEDNEKDMKASATFAITLGGVLSLMHSANLVTSDEAKILHHMIRMQNEFLVAAHELFLHDGNVNELQDTMIRCVKLVTRRMVEENKRFLNPVSLDDADDESDDYDDDDDDDEEEEEVEARSRQSNTQLDDILSSLGVQNTWGSTVPSRFILAVFAAAQKELLEVGQARALCDLYHAKYDLVRAAWEVYNVQGDVVDFTDTLRRIVRDLNFREDGNVQLSSPALNQQRQTQDVLEAVQESRDRTEQAYSNKQQAFEAVVEAKQELLRHSLEMMVKQDLIAGDAAQKLFVRAVQGDPLTDAAIEAYASDRNIMEFLDTLQILANNTPEEINRIMRAAVEEDESEEEEIGDEKENDDGASSKSDEYDDSDFEDDDDDDDDTQELDDAQKKLYGVVLELVEEDMINAGTATILMTLINNKDDRVMAAFDVYSEYEDKDDLVDSLLRVARKELQQHLASRTPQEDDEGIELSSMKKGQVSPDGKHAEVEMTQFKKDDDEADNVDQSKRGLLNASDQKSILDILAKAGAIEQGNADRITNLINEGNAELQQIFLEYEQSKDVYRLIENLRSFSASNGGNDSQDDSDGADEDDEDGDNDDGDGDNDEIDIESKFLNIIQGMNLSHLETAALRLAIARDDFAVRSALEMFRVSRDEEELIETLRRVAKATIDNTLTEAGYDGIQEDDVENDSAGESSADGDDKEDQCSDDENDSEANKEEVDEDEDEDEDESAENEGGLMSTQAAREYIFPILLSELVKEKVIGEGDGEVLKKLFSSGDAVVNAALDVYDLDNDMAELVDTLQKVAGSQ